MDKFLLGCSFLLLVITSVRCFYNKKKTHLDVLLNISLISLLLNSSILYLFYIDKLKDFIHLYRLGTFFTFTFISSSFLYIKYALSKAKLSAIDFIAFLPALLYLIDYSPFFFSNADYKLACFENDMNNNTLNLHQQSWFIPNGFHFILQNGLGVSLTLYQFLLIGKTIYRGGNSYLKENKMVLIWFLVWSSLLFLSCFPDLIFGLTGNKIDITNYTIITPCILLYFWYPFSILLTPDLLYGVKGFWLQKQKTYSHVESHDPNLDTGAHIEVGDILNHSTALLREVKSKYRASDKAIKPETNDTPKKAYYDAGKAQNMKKAIDDYMLHTKAYLNETLTIQELAENVNMSSRQVSSLLNSYAGVNYKDYVNSFRINDFIAHYKKNPEAKLKTLEHLSREFGFNSRFTFLHAFKKMTGKTPSAFFNTNLN